jgi:hypothetical protein
MEGPPIPFAQRPDAARNRHELPTREQQGAIRESIDGLQIVRGEEHDAPVRPELAQPLSQRVGRRVVQAGEWLVEEDQAGSVQQRSFERKPLPHTARKPSARIIAVLETCASKRGANRPDYVGHAIRAREETQVFSRRQLRID